MHLLSEDIPRTLTKHHCQPSVAGDWTRLEDAFSFHLAFSGSNICIAQAVSAIQIAHGFVSEEKNGQNATQVDKVLLKSNIYHGK